MRIAFLAPAVAVALLTVTGCAGQGEAPSAKRLAALTSNGVHVDYTPLASPREAVAEGDLIVRGTLTDVVDGITVKSPDRSRPSARRAPTRRTCSRLTRCSPAMRPRFATVGSTSR